DIYQVHLRPHSTEAELTLVGKVVSWVVVAALVVIAIGTDKTLVRLLELKFEVLIQIVPCFFLGLYWKRLGANVALLAMLAGLAVALGLTAVGVTKVYGFHAGVVGLGLNFLICAMGTKLMPDHAPKRLETST
ncbi:MAG TPA: sodium:solute symporter family protein, partial [Candidatus Handelsmanbacteria bacterium]|nr:sodium:solute symporter family protein [Candidatus Handelsmanbacteria bacterium]